MTTDVDLKISHADLLKSVNFAKIESLKKQLQEKDTEIDVLNKRLQEKYTEIDALNNQLTASKVRYMNLLEAAKSYVAVVECPSCVYITGDNCRYDCEECENCGKRHLNCKGCEYHFECLKCGGRCCDTCGEKCHVCKGYTCYVCGFIVCEGCTSKTPKKTPELSLE